MASHLDAPRVMYVQYTNPGGYPPIHHSARQLADSGFDVLMLGTVRDHNPMTVPAHDGVKVKLMRFEPAGWRQKLHYLKFSAWIVASTLRYRPRWIYASDPLACPAVWLASRVVRTRVVYHEHDSPSAEQHQQGSWFWRLVLKARRGVGRACDICILPNDQRAETFREETGREDVVTVWNCPMPDEVAVARSRHADGRLRVVYHGSIVPSRLPETVLEALAGLPSGVTLDVIGYETVGHRGYVDSLKRLAAQLGISNRVNFSGAIRRDDLMRGCATYDVGLSLLPRNAADPNQRTMTGASNKPFDYMACGVTLLVSSLPDWQTMFVEPGYALSCEPDSANSIQAALQWCLDHPLECVAMGERGRRQVLTAWNYERVFAPVLSEMQAGLTGVRARVERVSPA